MVRFVVIKGREEYIDGGTQPSARPQDTSPPPTLRFHWLYSHTHCYFSFLNKESENGSSEKRYIPKESMRRREVFFNLFQMRKNSSSEGGGLMDRNVSN